MKLKEELAREYADAYTNSPFEVLLDSFFVQAITEAEARGFEARTSSWGIYDSLRNRLALGRFTRNFTMTAPLKSRAELAIEYGNACLKESDQSLARLAFSVGFDAGFQRAVEMLRSEKAEKQLHAWISDSFTFGNQFPTTDNLADWLERSLVPSQLEEK